MIDYNGNWIEEKDYSTYPKEKWCFMDYMASWIREQNYIVKTDMENLIDIAYSEYLSECEYEDKVAFPLTEDINEWAKDVQEFIETSGGLKEFDYYS